ncbi:hypothetical protein CVT24_006193 [Panaeolus cyanescens]|uniref:DUF300-domain-containing protein n=1 Tax=Panaeolus cyanescens TaxID=181874 RepID=A0A409V8Q2_9AGAR|nr:hypothetical protein CVT24_006193 [Panaeolus cyanescens]
MSNHTEADDGLCHKEIAAQEPPPLFQNGNVVFQTYHIGWIVSGCFALIAIITSFWLVRKHLQWYTNPAYAETRTKMCAHLPPYKRRPINPSVDIVRLLFMVPLYAIISFASFIFWNHSTPLILVRDAYEAIVLTAFFYLLLMYLSHDEEEQKRIFMKAGLSKEADRINARNGKKRAKWVFPLGFVKWKPKDGLYFLQLMKWGVLQYCVIRPTTTLAAVILDYMGLYCESSWGLGWGHSWIMIIISLSVTVAMYCLIQLYVVVSKELAPHKPLLKLFAIKAVVFLTFWQATFLSLLSMVGVIKGSQFMTAEDINIGIGAVLETFEMMLFSFLHIKAFTYKPYREPIPPELSPPSQTPQWRSLGHAMDFRETFREIWVGCIYLFDKTRGREPKPDFKVRRTAHYEGAFGRPRIQKAPAGTSLRSRDSQEGINDLVFPAVEVHVDQEIGHPRQEGSESLQVKIDRELEKLGHPTEPREPLQRPIRRDESAVARVPWWRTVYNRLSTSRQEAEYDDSATHRRLPTLLSYDQEANPYDTISHNYRSNNGYDSHPYASVLYPVKHHSTGVPSNAAQEQAQLLEGGPAQTSPSHPGYPIPYPYNDVSLPFPSRSNPAIVAPTYMPEFAYGTRGRYGPASKGLASHIFNPNPRSQISSTSQGVIGHESTSFPMTPQPSTTENGSVSAWLRSLVHPRQKSEYAEDYPWSPPNEVQTGPDSSTPSRQPGTISSHRREPARNDK